MARESSEILQVSANVEILIPRIPNLDPECESLPYDDAGFVGDDPHF
jgi:hypothetical protein